MINKVEFTAKNLTSNGGVLPLLNYTDEQEIFQDLDEMLIFDNKSTEEIKMNHLKTLICGGIVGTNKLERFLLLKSDPLIKECGINVREPENISRFLYSFSFKTTQMLRDINFKTFKKLLTKKKLRKIRLIQKIYNVDPLKCPNCGGKMRIIAFIEEETVIRKILTHLNKWLPQYHDPPDHLGNYNMPASLNVDTIPSHNETLENTQLNMFSERTYEWWESNKS